MAAGKGLSGDGGGEGLSGSDGRYVYVARIGTNDGGGQVHRGDDDTGARVSLGTHRFEGFSCDETVNSRRLTVVDFFRAIFSGRFSYSCVLASPFFGRSGPTEWGIGG